MAEELWRPSLDLALHRNRQSPQVRFVQFATVRKSGRPAVRTLVFRGFLDDTHRLTFATDWRSYKTRELEHSPWVEACWFFHLTREQFRLSGTAVCVDGAGSDRALSAGAYRSLASHVRRVEGNLHLAGPWRPEGSADPLSHFAPDPLEPLPHFCLLVFEVRDVDHLELHGNPQHRWRYSKDDLGRWSGTEVNP